MYKQDRLRQALTSCRSALIGTALLSLVVNVLYLTGSAFMLEVYDRVIPSRSISTLVGLCLIAAMLYLFQWVFDGLRGRLLVRVGSVLDQTIAPDVFAGVVQAPLGARQRSDALLPLRDLDQVRSFISGGGPAAFCDLPWIPFYLLICWAFHPILGGLVLVGGLLLLSFTLVAERAIRRPAREAASMATQRFAYAEGARRNAEVVRALGMTGRMTAHWDGRNTEYRDTLQRATDLTLSLTGAAKVMRMMLQSAVIAVGAWLVIEQQATAGVIIAASILSARALAPVEQVTGQWKTFLAARQSWSRLAELLPEVAAGEPDMLLPKPERSLSVAALAVVPPGSERPSVRDVGFELKAGQGLGVIGPSGSGKSSLARTLVGVWQAARGGVRLDGASLDQWDPNRLGRHLGYLPQDVELFSGSIANNIARFDPEATPEKVLAATHAAGVHELIVSLPGGYRANIGEGGMALSAGQRQRIALARALYDEPFLVVLDEPNSNLDVEGERALTAAIATVRERGSIVVVVAHRPSALAALDMVLSMADGRMTAFGPKEEVLRRVLRPVAPAESEPNGGAGALPPAEERKVS